MPVPRKVREQAEQAEQQLNELTQQDTGDEPAPQASEHDGDDTTGAPADSGHADTGSETSSEATDTGEQTQSQDETGKFEETTGEPIEEAYRRLKAAHETLHGKYKKEVPRLNQQLSDAQDRIAELEGQLRDAQSRLQQSEQGREQAEGQVQQYEQYLRDEYGEEFSDAVNRVAEQVASQKIDEKQREQDQTEWDRFISAVKRNIPDFDAVNEDQAFVDWLNKTYDPDTGDLYQHTLNQASADRDVNSVIRVFSEFKRARDNAAQPQPTAPENQEAPRRKGQQAPPEPSSERQYTPEDYQQLQQEILAGRWKGREAEARQLEAEIHAAITQ